MMLPVPLASCLPLASLAARKLAIYRHLPTCQKTLTITPSPSRRQFDPL